MMPDFRKNIVYWQIIHLLTFLFFSANLLASADQQLDVNPTNTENNEQLKQLLPQLLEKNFKKKITTVEQLASINDPQTMVILEALLETRLFYQKSDKHIVIVQQKEDGYNIFNPLNNSKIGEAEKKSLQKITTNNKLRKTIRSLLAQKKILNPDLNVRQAAIQEILTTNSPDLLPVLQQARTAETDNKQKELLELAIALIEVDGQDKDKRLSAIKRLGNSLYPVAKGKLTEINSINEQDKDIVRATEKALKRINSKLSLFGNLETLFFGLSLGSVLLLAAIGLSITFGVMGVINMAHGELIMLGAYTTYLIQQIMPNNIDLSLLIAIPAAFIVAGLFGIAIERGVIRHLYGRPLETLLATFGISLLLQQMVRTLISAQNVAVITPSWLSGSLIINPAFSITFNRIYIFIFALLVFAVLMLILKKTSLGLQVRAVAQNRDMATAMGIKTKWVDSLTFGLGSGIAGIAGVALSQLTNVGPNLGQAYIIDSFMVVVFGGVENLWGTLVAAMTLGITNKFLEPWVGAVMAKIIVLIFLIIFIQKRPNGLFPQKGRSSGGH